jgi:hypothetical protein
MLKKNYLLVAVLSFMFISPAFSMKNEDEGSSAPRVLSLPVDAYYLRRVREVKSR